MAIDIGLCAQTACIWEATARKPGNVHPYRNFGDVTYLDFVLSAASIGPVLNNAFNRRVGETILECVRATQRVTRTNTNLGIILLLAPLAAVPANEEMRSGVARILDGLDVEDARLAYQAIRHARPGGLGAAAEQDVAAEPTISLREAMVLSADRDLIARQYANGYREVFDDAVAAMVDSLQRAGALEQAIIRTQLLLLSRHPDTLIARKLGPAEAEVASARAGRVLAGGWPEKESGRLEFERFDDWLRDECHARNPGTTADLITAALFVLLRDGRIGLPPQIPWTRDPASSPPLVPALPISDL
jgi:triphosphoribosyl-dephospho-CoA synthase